MSKSGYLIKKFKDTNPFSPTYNTTKEEKVYDPITCPDDSANWTEVSRSCQLIPYQPSGVLGKNGKADVLYEDINPNSLTFGQQKTEVVSDLTSCPLPNTSPDWELESSECEIN